MIPTPAVSRATQYQHSHQDPPVMQPPFDVAYSTEKLLLLGAVARRERAKVSNTNSGYGIVSSETPSHHLHELTLLAACDEDANG